MIWKLAAAGLSVTLVLSACASRPETGFLVPVAYNGSSTEHSILVATTRARDPRPGTFFNGERESHLNYSAIQVAVPQSHVSGEVELASKPPGDPAKNFVVTQAGYLDSEKEFIARLNAELATRPAGNRRVLLFVHGYNTMFAEGLYRFTQIVHDAKAHGVPVFFSWASRGEVTQYVYDTNSATAARDDLDRTIRLLFASNADQINILAHSMGNWVTVEALRQIKQSGRPPPASKLGTVILAAPDIDIDVFKSQMRSIGEPRKPFYVILSKDDKALRASNFLAGGSSRLGAAQNAEELAALGAIVVDMTDVKGNDSANHGKFAVLAQLGPEFGSVLANGISDGPAPPGTQGTLGAIVTSPITALSGTIRLIGKPGG